MLRNSILARYFPATLFVQIRGRKRARPSQMSKMEKAKKRLIRAEKEAERKRYSFMEKVNIRAMKSKQSPSQQYPKRLLLDEESDLLDEPPCDVFFFDSVKTQYHSIVDAIRMHRETQHPSSFDNPNAPVRLRLELNMTTEKKTKFLPSAKQIVPVPYPFIHGQKRSIIAFAQSDDVQQQALEAGAETVLGSDMIKKIVKGQFRTEDYDFAVAHTDMTLLIPPLRGILKKKFPTKLNGGLGEDMTELIEKFRKGVEISIESDPVYPHWGLCDTIVAKLEMNADEIEANISSIIDSVCRHRNPALGWMINRALMMVVPGEEYFSLNIDEFLPIPTDEELEKLEKMQSKRKKK